MRRAIMAVALGVGLSSAHAQSSVSLYGIADAGFSYFSHSATKGHFNFLSGGNDSSRWGLRGFEDLGGGLTAVFDLQNGFDIGSGAFASSGTQFNRQAFVGLSSAQYGTVTFGRQYEPMTDLLERYGSVGLAGGMASFAGDVTNIDNNIRVNNSVKYKTPDVAGFKGDIIYGFGNASGALNAGSTLGVGFSYARGPLVLGGAYLRVNNSATTVDSWASGSSATLVTSAGITAGLLGARQVQIADGVANYTIGKWTAALTYGHTQYRPSALSYVRHTVAFNAAGLAMAYQFTPGMRLGIAYSFTIGQSQDAASTSSAPHYQQLSLKGTYNLSNRTLVYAIAGYAKASGQTLSGGGAVIGATANLGDATNGSGPLSGNQGVVKMGFETRL